jgi:carboxymethylenebutenolidase
MDQSTKQQAIDLYDRYTHEGMDRRLFMADMARIAGGVAAAELLVASIAASPAAAAVVPADDKRLTTRTQDLVGSYKTYVAEPRSRSLKPTVLVIHENRGLNPYIEDVVRRMGAAGFLGFGPDALTPLGGYPGTDEEGVTMQRGLDAAKIREDFVAAAEFLMTHRESTGKVGAVGFCFGGGMVNTLAVRLPNLAAGVPFYGAAAATEDVPKINAPLLLQFAENDAGINGRWPAYEEALKAAGKRYTAYTYPGTSHGFHNDTTPRYDEAAAKLAQERTIAFFNEHLR